SRLFIIGTYRDTDLDRQHPLMQVLPDLRRLPQVERMVLRGLDEPGLVELLERVGDQPADAQLQQLAAALLAETEGNPLFVGEVLRDLVESGALVRTDGRWAAASALESLELPEGVRAVIGQRLSRLGESANTVLRIAALIGREFDTDLVVEASAADPEAILDAVDRALAAQLLEETERDRYRFTHALVRGVLVDELSSA